MNVDVKKKFDAYPEEAKRVILEIRSAIYDVANNESLGDILETLKWGEPSYQSKQGSAIRLGWQAKNPSKVSVYVNCKTSLAETFREMFGDKLHIIGNREIALPISSPVPMSELTLCISMSLRYHLIKHLPLLGA